jgi:hypothetical protein
MRKTLPTVKFLLPSIRKEAEVLTMFLCSARGFDRGSYIFNRHPELKIQLGETKDSEEVYKICYKYANDFRRKYAKEFKQALKQNEEIWRPIEKQYLQTLSEHFETDYPPDRRIMRAYVSMIPIYPRWLDEWSFNVSYFVPSRVREIACHEIQHFLYFKKWMEVFPKTQRKELDNPHLIWRLSELVDPVMLNEHPYFKILFDCKQLTYKHFQEIRIRGRQPMTHLAIIYRRHLKSKKSFATFLEEIWKFAKDNEEILMEA